MRRSARDPSQWNVALGSPGPPGISFLACALLAALLLIPCEASAQGVGTRGRASIGSSSTGARGSTGIGARSTPGDRIRSGSLGDRIRSGSSGDRIRGGSSGDRIRTGSLRGSILGSDVRRRRSSPGRLLGQRATDRRASRFPYRGLAGPRGYTGLGPPGTYPTSRTFRSFRTFGGFRGLWISLRLNGLFVRLGLVPRHFSRGWRWSAFHGRPWVLLVPPANPLQLPGWGVDLLSADDAPAGPFGASDYWEDEELYRDVEPSFPDDPGPPPTGPDTMRDGEAELEAGGRPSRKHESPQRSGVVTSDPGDTRCAVVEVRFRSGAATSSWVALPTAGASSPDELQLLLDQARRPGASSTSREAWRAMIPASTSEPEGVSVRPCAG